MSDRPMISLQNIRIEYPLQGGLFKKNTFVAIKNVSMDIVKGDTWSIVGESGSGKTTLGMAIIGMTNIADGTIQYNLEDLQFKISKSEKNSKQFRHLWKRISIVFQDPFSALDGRILVKDVINEPYVGHKLGTREEGYNKMKELINETGLKPIHLDYLPDQLSGGLRQRVAITRALMLEPDFIVFDEPTSSLDVSVQAQILNLILDTKEKTNLTYMFITHNLLVARHISKKILVLYLGEVMEIGNTEEVFEKPLHPYTQLLMRSIPVPGKKSSLEKIELETTSASGYVSGCVFHNRCPMVTEFCGWSPGEIIDIISSEMYSITGSENLDYEILNDTHILIRDKDPENIKLMKKLIDESQVRRFKNSDIAQDGLHIYLGEAWKPHLIQYNDKRQVNCIHYDLDVTTTK